MLEKIKNKLLQGNFFKFIIGASYKNLNAIRNLSHIFAMAGTDVIDAGADPEAVKAVKTGIMEAGVTSAFSPLIMISIGMNEDVHFVKLVKGEDKCVSCMECLNVCPNQVFSAIKGELSVRYDKCVGCRKCVSLCPFKALELINSDPATDCISKCMEAGADALEIHCGNGDFEQIKNTWVSIDKFKEFFKLISFSIGGHELSIDEISELICNIKNMVKEDVIWQLDGSPISGHAGETSTLEALELAGKIRKIYPEIFIQLSGGVNDLTHSLARKKNVKINGIGMGSFARSYIKLKDVENMSYREMDDAVKLARKLIPCNLKEIK